MVNRPKPKGGGQPPLPAADAAVHSPEFGRLVTRLMRAANLTDDEVAREIGASRQSVAFYRKGERLPRKDKFGKLAALLGISTAELYAAVDPDAPVAAIIGADIQQITPDELALLKVYRKLSPTAQKLVRARAAQLLEQFGKPDRENPYGKGTQ